jgi:hypothetical protein
MEQKENIQLNQPAKNYFEHKLKCDFSRVGFSFSAGELDVLAYNRRNKCFHVCEGKRASNIASVGHAIGQLIAYISMIQEYGYDFLNRVSKEERLELTDFSNFLEKKAIKVCFYIILPKSKKDKLLMPAKLMLNNIGDFGNSIGIFFASNKTCELEIPSKPLDIKIRRTFSRDEFLKDTVEKVFEFPESRGLVIQPTNFQQLVQIKEKNGNPFLHFEVWFKKKRKSETKRKIEVAFHIEFAKAHLKDVTGCKRKIKLQKTLLRAEKDLKKSGIDFKYESKWGKNWSRLYNIYETDSSLLDDELLSETLHRLKILVNCLKPKLDNMNWGRKRLREAEEVQKDY